MFKKVLSLLLVLCMLSFVGCSGTKNIESPTKDKTTKPYEGTELNVLLEGHPASEAMKALVGEFEEETGIKVNIEIIPYAELPRKVMLSFSQKSDDYDVIMNDGMYKKGYIENDYIAPLDKYLAMNNFKKYYNPQDLISAYSDALKVDDKIYGMPSYGESTFLMYRKDLFEEYGIEIPKTIEDLLAAAKTVTEKSNGKISGMTMRGQQGVHIVYTWSTFLWANGGSWFDSEGNLNIATPEAIKAAEQYVKLLNEYGPVGVANFGWQENRLAFQQGQAAMTIDATVNGAFCEDAAESEIVGLVGYAPSPVGGGEQIGGQSALTVHGLFVNNFSKNKEAAALFTAWATSKDFQSKSLDIESHSGITSLGAMETPVFTEKYGKFKDAMLAALEAGNMGYMPQSQYTNEIINVVGTALSQVLTGTKTAEDALTEANENINTNVMK